jgi:predicted SAM-dependent methyltransferase
LGSGYKRYEGVINIDNDKNCKPDFICNFEIDPLPFKDNSVDKIIAHHILEHIGEGYIIIIKVNN